MRGRLFLALISYALFSLPTQSHAIFPWPLNGQQICVAPFSQVFPKVVTDGFGGAIMVWEDPRNGGANNIFAQRVDAFGVAQWTPDGVAITGTNDDRAPQLMGDGAGGAIITWYRGGNIYAQYLNALGNPLWPAGGVVISSAAGAQQLPVLVSDNAGGAIIAWQDLRNAVDYDVYVQRVSFNGVPQWTANGVAVCTAVGNQTEVQICVDGNGGAVIAWSDTRTGTPDIYVQKVNLAGLTQWTANGVALCTAADFQVDPSIVSDGNGGAYVAWEDNRTLSWDVYARRVSTNGVALWAANGIALSAQASVQLNPVLLADGSGGAFAAWDDARTGGLPDIYVQRLNSVGTALWLANGVALDNTGGAREPDMTTDGLGGVIVAWYDDRVASSEIYARRINGSGVPQWTANGVALTNVPNTQDAPAICSDGVGGAIVVFEDARTIPSFTDIYAQRIERNGHWGYPSPLIFEASDIPGDQGGQVNLSWYASRLDPWPDELIDTYTVWRAIDEIAATAAIEAGATRVRDGIDPLPAAGGEVVRVQELNGVTYFWKLMSTLGAYGLQGYSEVVPTLFDSTAVSSDPHYFQVIAHAAVGQWASPPASGRSLDNIAPSAVLQLSAQRVGPDVHLIWNQNDDADLNEYAVYRHSASGVTPTPIYFLSSTVDTIMTDAGAPGGALYYIVTAIDEHLNQGPPSNEASVSPVTDVKDTPTQYALSLSSYPNPFNPRTTVSYTLPSRGLVTLAVYDSRGARVATLVNNAMRDAGVHKVEWDGRASDGVAVSSGVYFAKIEHASGMRAQKLVLLK